jgi:hypothetical protein
MTTGAEVKPSLGAAVEYRDTKGRSKAAWVIGTPGTTDGELACEPGELHLFIVSAAGQPYVRHHVLRHDADEPLAGSGSWRPIT